MNQELLGRLLHRPDDANKYDFGHVLIMGGSPGMVGAPLLAGEAALRTGAGLVTVAAPVAVADKLERRVREIMTLTLPDELAEAVRKLLAFVDNRKVTAVVVGPGLDAGMRELCVEFLRRLELPAVIDAGGLMAFRGDLPGLKEIASKNKGLVLTPHSGEYEKLAGKQAATDFAAEFGLTVVLKGHHTLVAHPDGTVYENATGNPGLATAGTGDVLSGVIAGLLAQGVAPAEAAEAGVYWHGLAGDLAAAAKTQAGMIASDVTEFLPAALKSLAARAA